MQRKTPPPRAHVRAVGWQSAHVDGRGESSKMHRHCVFKDRGPNCSARKLKRRSIVMLATSCWRPQAYASARGCVMQKPLVTALRFSALLLARNSRGLETRVGSLVMGAPALAAMVSFFPLWLRS